MRSSLSVPLRLAFAAALLLVVGCAGESSSGGASTGTTIFPDEPFDTVTSAAGKVVVEVRTSPEQPPVRGVTAVELTLTDPGGEAMEGVTVSAVPWMPDMGHGASVKPAVVALGGGRYEVDNVTMFMAGRWELRLQITGAVEDSAKVVFQIP